MLTYSQTVSGSVFLSLLLALLSFFLFLLVRSCVCVQKSFSCWHSTIHVRIFHSLNSSAITLSEHGTWFPCFMNHTHIHIAHTSRKEERLATNSDDGTTSILYWYIDIRWNCRMIVVRNLFMVIHNRTKNSLYKSFSTFRPDELPNNDRKYSFNEQ